MLEPFELYSHEIDADPFPGYARLRDEAPCYWSESAELWILTRYDDVANAAQSFRMSFLTSPTSWTTWR